MPLSKKARNTNVEKKPKGGNIMPHKYDKYKENFRKRVADDASKPDLFKGKPMELMPEDDDEAVEEYFEQRGDDSEDKV